MREAPDDRERLRVTSPVDGEHVEVAARALGCHGVLQAEGEECRAVVCRDQDDGHLPRFPLTPFRESGSSSRWPSWPRKPTSRGVSTWPSSSISGSASPDPSPSASLTGPRVKLPARPVATYSTVRYARKTARS